MKLKKISLRNYRQHENLDVEFKGHMIAILGANGSGKSNFIGANQFALTGEQPGFDKGDLLNWGAAQRGEGGYVDLVFEHNGPECRVQRRIEKPAVTLKVGEDTYTGTKKVQEAMETILNIDKDVLRQSVFVRQKEIDSVLFTDPRERELAFQRLIGLGDAAKHNKFLTDYLSATQEPQSMVEEIARQKELVESQKTELARLRSASGALAVKLAGNDDTERFQKEVAQLQDYQAKIATVIRAMDEKDRTETVYKETVSKYGEMFHEKPRDLQEFTDFIAKTRTKIGEANVIHGRNSQRGVVDSEIRIAKGKLEVIPVDWKEQHDKLLAVGAEANELRGKIAQLDKLLKDAPDGNICPLCGSTADHNIREEIQRERDEAFDKENELQSWIVKHQDAQGWPALREKLLSEIASLEKEAERLGPPEEYPDVNALKADLAKCQAELNDAAARNQSIQVAGAKVHAAQEAWQAAGLRLGEAMCALPNGGQGVTRETLQAASDNMGKRINEVFSAMNEMSELKSQKAQLDGGIAQVERAIKEAEDGIVRLEQVDADNKEKSAKLQVVRDVKDWFSYKNGPRVMTQAIMGLLVGETNKYLEYFGAEFTVIPMEEGMGFRYVYNDGRTVSNPPPEATMLSGGQKVTLAIAFRFAVYSMFSAKLGLLVLDEPTVYLDDRTVGQFADVLSKIKEFAANSDLQILISTHVASLAHVFDQTITIGA